MPFSAEARVATETPSRFLQQLCKHFAHKIPVSFDEHAGHIAFEAGTCALRAEGAAEGTLLLRVEAGDAESVLRLQDVVARHLLRFAFRAPPIIRWEAMPPSP